MVDDDVLAARAYLSRVSEAACIPVWGLVQRVGPVEAARRIRAGDDEATRGVTEARRMSSDPYADLEAAERFGMRLVTPESDEWPHFAFTALERAGAERYARYQDGERNLSDSGEPMPPLALWVTGPADLASVGVRSVGIVGSRGATTYGEQLAAEFGYGLAGRGVVVVSGGAYGIDAAAHRGAMAAGGVTVVVSAAGLDRPYPVGNASLFARAAESGLVISESPPGAAPHRHRFLTRNRVIAALSTGTVVVEAARRSGAANTAGHCRTLGRPVMAVPGPVTSPMSAGCHDLIRRDADPAVLVTGVHEVLAVVGAIGEGLAESGEAGRSGASSGPGATDVRPTLDALDCTARRVFEGLSPRRFSSPEEISRRCGVSSLEVIRALPALHLAGLVEAGDAGYRIAARFRRSA